jgi:hypothetical protein
MEYRVYLIGSDDHIRAGESFSAADDLEAEEVAFALFEGCSTSFRGLELWKGQDVLLRRKSDGLPRPTLNLQELIDRRQESVVRLEEALSRSFECVRQSRQLMATLDQIRESRPDQGRSA